MLSWLKLRGLVAPSRQPDVRAEAPKRPGRAMSGKYLLLYEYLENRYADTVVLTFSEIEDLLGFALPDEARAEPAWWTPGLPLDKPGYSNSWRLASRTAAPNLNARIVVFERAA